MSPLIQRPLLSQLKSYAISHNKKSILKFGDNGLRKCVYRRNSQRNVVRSNLGRDGEIFLDKFWESRGVMDPERRQQLLAVAKDSPIVSDAAIMEMEYGLDELQNDCVIDFSGLSGVALTWSLLDENVAKQVVLVSRRLLFLRKWLGNSDDLDLVWMVEKEPDLLTADISGVVSRLVELRTAEGASEVDVMALIQKQPSLLLEQGSASSSDESVSERQEAWDHGLLGDGDMEWSRRFEDLKRYRKIHHDCHVGFRDGDDSGLSRWARKQRKQYAQGRLSSVRADQLLELGFVFDEENAEWLRWYNEIKKFSEEQGHCNPIPLASGADFLLINWCSIQRIARRSGRLSLDKKEKLDAIGFDWTGADALS